MTDQLMKRPPAEHYISQMVKAWPGTIPGKGRFEQIAMSLALRDPILRECSMASKLVALNECCKLGLIPDRNLGHVYMIPFRVKGELQVQVILGYKGLLELARRSGMIKNVETAVVYANDNFTYVRGTQPILRHIPWWHIGQASPGEATAAWCSSVISGSNQPQVEVMHVSEINAIRARSKAKGGPWDSDWEMMARKTVLKRASKLWSLTPELASAVAIDDLADAGRPLHESEETDRSGLEEEGSFGFASPGPAATDPHGAGDLDARHDAAEESP